MGEMHRGVLKIFATTILDTLCMICFNYNTTISDNFGSNEKSLHSKHNFIEDKFDYT